MLLSRRRLFGLSALTLLGACSTAEAIAPMRAGGGTPPGALTREAIIAAINGVRRANGRPPLLYSAKLEAAAREQANLMASKDQLSHFLGVTLRERVRNAGYVGAVGENVAGGQRTLEQAIEGWMNSSGHRDTLLSTKFVEFGLAVAVCPASRHSRYGIYWAMIAGGPTSAWIS